MSVHGYGGGLRLFAAEYCVQLLQHVSFAASKFQQASLQIRRSSTVLFLSTASVPACGYLRLWRCVCFGFDFVPFIILHCAYCASSIHSNVAVFGQCLCEGQQLSATAEGTYVWPCVYS